MDYRRSALGAVLALAVGGGCGDAAEPAADRPATDRPAASATTAQAQRCAAAPVLLPGDPVLRRAARTTAIGAGHSVTTHAGGLNVEITSLPQPGGAGAVSIQQTEYGFDASFARDCGLYNVSLTCDQEGDARCADERYIRALVGDLAPG